MTDHQIANIGVVPSRTPALRNNRTDWLSRWLVGETPDNTLLEQQGFQPNHYYAVVIYRPAQPPLSSVVQNSAQFATLVHTEASRRGVSGPIVAYNTISAVLFHPVEDPQQTTRLKRKTEEIRKQVAARLVTTDVSCGVGRPMLGMDALRASFREAEQALQVSDDLQMQSQTTFFGNSSLFSLLLSLRNPEELSRFCQNWLSDLISYDARQHSDLLETLRAYFANNGNTALTAKELRIHRNTLAYRLNRIAEITRLDLEDADVRLNLHLALKAYEVLSAAGPQ